MSNDEQHVIHKEIAALQDEVRLLRGALRAQDDRERQAGKLCDVPYEESGCDWPFTVAEELVLVRQQLADREQRDAILTPHATMHPYWSTAPREKLEDALRWQGALSKVLMEEHDGLIVERDTAKKQLAIEQQRLTTAAALLSRAAGSLNAYCEELNGDLNDSLATEIDLFLGTKEPC